jgi:hypothetical protein
MTTNLGLDEYLLLRFSIKSTAIFGSDITTVGLLPTQTVKIGPYIFDHSWNWIHGFDLGSWLPMNGRGVGPGGMRYHAQISLRRMLTGMAMRPAQVYQEDSAERKDIAI